MSRKLCLWRKRIRQSGSLNIQTRYIKDGEIIISRPMKEKKARQLEAALFDREGRPK